MLRISTIILLFCSISSAVTLHAQADSVPLGRVTYLQEVSLLGDVHKNGYASLLFNNSHSVYIHHGAPARDSSFVDTDNAFPVHVSGDPEGFPIYKIHADKQVYCKVICREAHPEHCIVRDTYGNIDWKLQPEHKRFGQYDCRRATGIFRGREYEVWYAPDIPVSSGPFKLGGLPGLILEAASLDGNVKFTFSKLEISNKVSGSIRFPSGKNIDSEQAEFEKEEDAFSENLVNEYRAKGIDMSVTRQETIEIW